jgi:hypothetical protein
VTNLPHEQIAQNQVRSVQFTPTADLADFIVEPNPMQMTAGGDAGLTVAQSMVQKVYRFSAERMALSLSAYAHATELLPNAANLPAVLSQLQGSRALYSKYVDLVKQVFPTIEDVTVRASPSNQAEILIWQIPPQTYREDLAIPLAESGTGIGQVLAILYVVVGSADPHTILIDEPSSFLHPGAARTLIRILKEHTQHQYLVSTHSPEVISELAGCPTLVVEWAGGESSVRSVDGSDSTMVAVALGSVGAKLSDVFGFDRVLWVEGQSDAATIKLLLSLDGSLPRDLAILPVRDTGSFSRRNAREILAVYRTLGHSGALLPPAVGFLFDRDGRSPKDIDDLRRESKETVHFIDRRMIENYLLDPASVAALIDHLGKSHRISVSPDTVESWFHEHGREARYGANQYDVLSAPWVEVVDAAKLIAECIGALTDAKLGYEKASATPWLARYVHATNPRSFDPLIALIRRIVESAGGAPSAAC